MDNLTHTLFAVTLSRTPLARAGRGATAALILSSNAPDIDIVTVAGGPTTYLHWHRGPTHGPIGLVVLSAVTALIVWTWRRVSARPAPLEERADASFAMLLALSAIGIAFHLLMDVPTSYGTRLLSPFAWRWYAVDLMPIVDVYLLVVLVAGILFGQQSAAARRRNAVIVFTLMAANYGVRGALHHRALTLVPRLFGPTLPARCAPEPDRLSIVDTWPREAAAALPASGRRCLVDVAAIPTFLSPFRWRIVAQFSNSYEIHDLDLLDERLREPAEASAAFWRLTLRYPNVWTPAVFDAARTHLGQVYLGFSRFPAARSVVDPKGVAVVRWSDMRFAAQTVVDRTRPADPFTATVRLAPDGSVLGETLGR